MRQIVRQNQFKKDLRLMSKRNKDLNKLIDVVDALANDLPLATRFKDHVLRGNYKDCRECHIEPDWLLIYQLRDDLAPDDTTPDASYIGRLDLIRTGSHNDLFGK